MLLLLLLSPPLLLLLLLAAAAAAVAVDAGGVAVYQIGGIFADDDDMGQLAFQLSVDAANELLNSSDSQWHRVRLKPVTRLIPAADPLSASREVCELLQAGVVAIAGPNQTSRTAAGIVHTYTHLHSVPHVFVTWGLWHSETGHHFTVNSHPSFKSYGAALRDFVQQQAAIGRPSVFTFALVYSDREALLKYESLFNNVTTSTLIRQWRKQADTYEYVMKYFSKLGQFNFFVDIPVSELEEFFRTASLLNMTREYYNYYITSWDADKLNYSGISRLFAGANVSTLILSPRQLPAGIGGRAQKFAAQMADKFRQRVPMADSFVPTEAALTYDAVQMLALGLSAAQQAANITPQRISCHRQQRWDHGPTLMNFVSFARHQCRRRQLAGGSLGPCGTITGSFGVGDDRFRSDYRLLIEERLPYEGSHEMGHWSEATGIVVTKNYSQSKEEIRDSLRRKTLKVTTIIDKPFVFYKLPLIGSQRPSTDPRHWDGFCIALLKNISSKLGFNISMHLVGDGQYGKIVGSGQDGKEIWNGMIGELMNRSVDIAIASLTITYDRERVIDFTTPFMSLGLSIIYKKPQKEEPSLFSFLYPLSGTVWAYMLAAYLMVSFILFTVARFSPFEWYNPSSCNPNSEVVENQFTITNSLWFTIGSLMQQGSELSPRANSTRMVSGFWWFFTLIMISSYTANLAAFLTVKRLKSPIENVEDLSKQKEIKYGILEGGSTFRFFQKATIPTYKSMFDFMSSNSAKSFVKSTPQGIERVLTEDYAFILESTWNEYYTQRNCQLMQVGGLLDSKGYGIGMPAGSPYVDIFSETILELQKNQTIEWLRQYWWRDYNISRRCDDTDGSPSNRHLTNALGLEQIGGAFIILTVGMAASVLCAAMEFGFKHLKRTASEPLWRSMWQELQFAVQCCVSSKRRSASEYQAASCGEDLDASSSAGARSVAPGHPDTCCTSESAHSRWSPEIKGAAAGAASDGQSPARVTFHSSSPQLHCLQQQQHRRRLPDANGELASVRL